MYKISFCTVCMNRLSYLEQTLPVNLIDNQDYENLEFILLDYNSFDGLESWVREHMQAYLETGKLIYYKTTTPVHFNRSHSKNLVHKLATGDLVCNIDADNYTGKGFAAYLNREFKNDDSIFLTAIDASGAREKCDVLGRICVKRTDFHNIGGYDERMTSYGFDDYDLANRLELNNVSRKLMESNPAYFDAISHSQAERINNDAVFINLKALLVNYLSPCSSDFVMLFTDGTFKRGIVIDIETYKFDRPLTEIQKAEMKFRFSLKDFWQEGRWQEHDSHISLYLREFLVQKLYFDQTKKCFLSQVEDTTSTFYQIVNQDFIERFIMFYSQSTNRIIMAQNVLEKRTIVNRSGFGKDVVYKNFDYQTPITV
ncbi:glycosyltransferase family A protein [Sphingobacterium corticibacterium]|nr:glycosyltransferase family A protein [Sphingobacterium corticibacterium]